MATYDLSDWEFGPLQGFEQVYGADLYARNKTTGKVERAYSYGPQSFGGPTRLPESMVAQVEADYAGQSFGDYDSAMAPSPVKYTPAAHVFSRGGGTLLDQALDLAPGIALGIAAGAVGGLAFGAGPLAGAAGADLGASGIAMTSMPAAVPESAATLAEWSAAGTEIIGVSVGAGGLGGVADSGAASMDMGVSAPSVTRSAASGLSGSDLALASMAAPQIMSMFAGAPELGGEMAASQDMEVAGVAQGGQGGGQGGGSEKVKERGRQFETRRQAAGRAARGAGAVRSGNEADLLGQNAQKINKGPRKAGQGSGRKLLGY